MSAIPQRNHIRAVFDGVSFVPKESVDLAPGCEVILSIALTRPSISIDQRWRSLEALRGTVRAPDTFNWNFDRGDLYRDAS